MANPLRRLGSGRNAVLLFDTATTALANVIVVIAASRSLNGGALDSFSLAQLVLVMLTQSVRTAIWSPALAAQRQTGKAGQSFSCTHAPPGRSPQRKKLGQRGQLRASGLAGNCPACIA